VLTQTVFNITACTWSKW